MVGVLRLWVTPMPNEPSLCCRVCGLYLEEDPWGEDLRSPTHEICACCGVQFGYEDSLPAGIVSYRQRWIDGGCAWFLPECRPEHWSAVAQLANASHWHVPPDA